METLSVYNLQFYEEETVVIFGLPSMTELALFCPGLSKPKSSDPKVYNKKGDLRERQWRGRQKNKFQNPPPASGVPAGSGQVGIYGQWKYGAYMFLHITF